MADAVIETERLILRSWSVADVAALHAICSDPRVMTYLGDAQSEDEIRAAIDRQNGFQSAHGHCFWAMERKTDGAMIGFCGLKPGPAGTPLEGRIEIGWRLAAHAWQQGYAGEAARASLDWGWAHLAVPSIWAITVPDNSRSRLLMDRIGMSRHEELDFDHPALPPGHRLRRHVTYSIGRPQ